MREFDWNGLLEKKQMHHKVLRAVHRAAWTESVAQEDLQPSVFEEVRRETCRQYFDMVKSEPLRKSWMD